MLINPTIVMQKVFLASDQFLGFARSFGPSQSIKLVVSLSVALLGTFSVSVILV
jgi:hypothetical protein